MCQLYIDNSFPVIRTTIAKKSSYLLTPAFIHCFSWGRPCGNHAKRCMKEKEDNSVLSKPLAACTHLSSTVSQLFEPQVQKIAVFTYSTLHFCFPCDYHAICCMDGKTIQCLSNPSQHVPICLQQFPSYSNRKCKNSPFSRTAAYDVDMAIWHVASFVNRDNFMVLICAIRFLP